MPFNISGVAIQNLSSLIALDFSSSTEQIITYPLNLGSLSTQSGTLTADDQNNSGTISRGETIDHNNSDAPLGLLDSIPDLNNATVLGIGEMTGLVAGLFVSYPVILVSSDGSQYLIYPDDSPDVLTAITEVVATTIRFNADAQINASGQVIFPDGTVHGTSGNDNMAVGYVDPQGDRITINDDSIAAGAGDDVIKPGEGNDTVFGGDGNDTIDDWIGNDLVYAGAGNDVANVSVGNDVYYMEDGDDLINVWDNADNNTFFGGTGTDQIDFQNVQSASGVDVSFNPDGSGSFSLFSGASTGTFDGFEIVSGTAFNDTLEASGSTVGVVLRGEAGDDTLTSGTGGDTLSGGADADLFTIGSAAAGGGDVISGGDTGVDDDTLDLTGVGNFRLINVLDDSEGNGSNGIVQFLDGAGNPTGQTLTFTNIETILGTPYQPATSPVVVDGVDTTDVMSPGYTDAEGDMIDGADGLNDTIVGNGGADTINAGEGNDLVNGGVGDDVIDGGAGDDTLLGDHGDDRFTFSTGDDSVTGGETGEGDGDTLDASAITGGLDLQFTGNESGTLSQNTTQDVTGPAVSDGSTTVPGGQFEFFILDRSAWNDPDNMVRDSNNTGAATPGDTISLNSYSGATVVVDGPRIQDSGVADLVAPVTINGETFPAGRNVELDYGFVVQDENGIQYFIGKIDIGGGAADWDGSVVTAGWNPSARTWGAPPEPGAVLTLINAPNGSPWTGFSFSDSVSTSSLNPYSNDARLGIDIAAPVVSAGSVTTTESITHSTTFSEIETFDLGGGNDTVDASATTDGTKINAGAGNDSVLGGAGADTLDGGAGNDTLTGGADADVFVAGGADLITDFDTVTGLGDDNSANNDFVDLSTFYNDRALAAWNAANPAQQYDNPLEWLRADQVDGVLDQAAGLQIQNGGTAVDGDSLNAENTAVCFVAGTLIVTGHGQLPIEDLKPGDLVLTMDHGFRPIRWIGSTKVVGKGALAPITIKSGALTNVRDLRVSPQHRMFLSGWKAQMLFGENEVLAAAKHLVNDTSIFQQECDQVEYYHILFDGHEIIFAEGCPAESFHPGDKSLGALGEETRQEIFALFPQLAELDFYKSYGDSARRSLKAHEARLMQSFGGDEVST